MIIGKFALFLDLWDVFDGWIVLLFLLFRRLNDNSWFLLVEGW